MKELIVITGPTAVGKSAAAIKVCEKIGGEVISADSMQVYRGMDIGTAKITKEETRGIPHHLMDILDPSEEFNVSVFQALAREKIAEIKGRGHVPVIAGGTGFYIRSVLYAASFGEEETDESLRKELANKMKEKGNPYMEEALASFDPVSAKLYHGNGKRIIRALEYYRLTGETLSEKNARERAKPMAYDAALFFLSMPREQLYERIGQRVDEMMEKGLLTEVRELQERGLDRSLTAMQGIGYRQLFSYLDGKSTLSEAVDEVKKETRHFAKRQITWFKKEKDVISLDVTSFPDSDALADEIIRICND